MNYRVLINQTVRKHLLGLEAARRQRVRRSFEFLESGLWEGGLRVKKLKGLSATVLLEGRIDRASRLLFTLGGTGSDNGNRDRLIYVWGVVGHDRVDRKAAAIVPENAPFLNFEALPVSQLEGVDLDELESCKPERTPFQAWESHAGQQRWFVLDEADWRRLLVYEGGEFEISLFLTPEQAGLLRQTPPLLLSGTAGSGKSTLAVYYLLRSQFRDKSKLFLTFNRQLRRSCQRLYQGLTHLSDLQESEPPRFLTFEELCRSLLPGAARRFPPECEMRLGEFAEIYHRYASSNKHDYALVWEEIRSIIKGGKPVLHKRRLLEQISRFEKVGPDPRVIRKLREDLLALHGLSISAALQTVVKKQLGVGIRRTAAQLEDLYESRRIDLLRALSGVAKKLARKDSGISAPLMTLAEYERLGRKRAPNFRQNRRTIHELAQRYQQVLQKTGRWDQIDLTRAALQRLDKHPEECPDFEIVVCDEVQDFTDLQLSLIFRLARTPQNLILAGDPKQIINPSGFRWEEVRRLFYDRRLPVPEVYNLTLNFRCSGSIVRLANGLLQLKRRLLGVQSHEQPDEWKFQGRPPCLLESASVETLLEQLTLTGADRMILTRDEAERDRLKQRLDTELVMTVREAKGLEFDTVLLWRFAVDGEARMLWEQIVREETRGLHEALIRHEINLLYVGATRARKNLILYDGPQASPVWDTPVFRDHIFRTGEVSYLSRAWQTLSTPEAWSRQGEYYFEHEHYAAAAECYRNGNRRKAMHRALALDAESKKRFARAARSWREVGELRRAARAHERAAEFSKALELWSEVGDEEGALQCRLRYWKAEGKFDLLAEFWGENGDQAKAARFWQKADRPDRAAPLLEDLGKPHEAAAAYQRAGAFDLAARIYERLKLPGEAARCWESARRWEEALRLWALLDRSSNQLRCLSAIGDPLRLGRFFETRGEWDKALKAYRSCWDASLETRFDAELKAFRKHRLTLGERALRLQMLERLDGAGQLWEKARVFSRAARCFEASNEYYAAGRCYQKAGQVAAAVSMFCRCPNRALRTRGLRQCRRKGLVKLEGGVVKELAGFARRQFNDGNYESASTVLEMLGSVEEAAWAAAMIPDIRRALRLLPERPDFERAAQFFIKHQRFAAGAQLFQRILAGYFRYYVAYSSVLVAFQDLLWDWFRHARDYSEKAKVAEYVLRSCRHFDPSLTRLVLDGAGWYDELLRSRRRQYESRTTSPADCTRLAERFERDGAYALAGVCYLWAGKPEQALVCWERFPIDEHNVECQERSGRWQEAIEFYLARSEFDRAAEAAARHRQGPLALKLARQSPSPVKVGKRLRSLDCLEEALTLFSELGDRKETARTLEKMCRFEEAAAVWEELEEHRRRAACLRKAQKTAVSQKALF